MQIFLIMASSEDAIKESFIKRVTKDKYVREKGNVYPLGLAYLGAVLKNAGHSIRLFNYLNVPFEDVDEYFNNINMYY